MPFASIPFTNIKINKNENVEDINKKSDISMEEKNTEITDTAAIQPNEFNVSIQEKKELVQESLNDSTLENNKSEFFKVEENNFSSWIGSSVFLDKKERFGFIVFMIPIILLSIVSTMSLIEFFSLGHPGVASIILGAAFESASLASVAALVLLKKLNKWALWSLIFILFGLQTVGNIYAPFFHLNPESAKAAFDMFGLSVSEISSKRIIAIIEGASLPLSSLFMFKITSVMFENKEKED